MNVLDHARLLCGVAFCAIATAAVAQTGAPTAAAPADAGPSADSLGEIVVTATKQTNTVNKVPLSISAVTQEAMDQEGLKNVQDLSRFVPALTINPGSSNSNPNISIRGIVTTAGAATTGVYLDDTPLTKRNVNGVSNNNGTPVPPLFDLERVEVLRGPQGTLYGGSSEGGTVRFITPTPSLTQYSEYGRAELATTEGGDPTYEAGFALGGPIVQDKLGFRVSIYDRKTGGYIDHVDVYTGQETASNTNSENVYAGRAVLLWQAAQDTKVTVSYYRAQDQLDDGSSFNLPYYGTTTTPSQCFDTSRSYPTATRAVPCPTGAVPANIFMRPQETYGPYPNLGFPDNISPLTTPATTDLDSGSISVEQDLHGLQLKSITSYLHDQTHSLNYDTSQIANANGGLPLLASIPAYPVPGPFDAYNKRHGFTEELRLSSQGSAISWVAGIYWSHIVDHSYYENLENLGIQAEELYGITTVQRYGVDALPDGSVATRNQALTDKELAAFGELNWYLTDKLKLTGGLRVSQVEFTYDQQFFGAVNNFLIPTVANGGLTAGSEKENPVTPKGGIEYDFTPNDLVYFTAAKGFRPGGVNSPLSPAICVGLTQQGLTASDVPSTYNSDSVWSYELGTKLRLLDNRLQVNTSVFRIDWANVQVSIPTTGCGQTYVTNAGAARSQGFDVQAQALVLHGLTVEATAGYDDATYTADAFGPTPKIAGVAATKVVNKGDALPVPVWTASLGARWDFVVLEHNLYARADYEFTGPYLRGFGAGVNSYAPDVIQAGDTRIVNARLGTVMGSWDVNLYVNNLFDSRDLLTEVGGRTGCAVATGAACTTFSNNDPLYMGSTFTPRTVGVQAAYRY